MDRLRKLHPLGGWEMTQQIDIKLTHRIETGKLQIGNDFPGYFIRSEDCLYLYQLIDRILNGEESTQDRYELDEYSNALRKV